MKLYFWKTPSLEHLGRSGIVTAAISAETARVQAGAAIYYDLGRLSAQDEAGLRADLAAVPEQITTGGLVLKSQAG